MCGGTGFNGQTAITEVVVVDDEARGFLASGDMKSAYNSSRLKHKLPGLQEAALLRVRDGTTSLEEAIRVLSPASKTAAPTATATATATATSKPTTASAAAPAKPTTTPSEAKPSAAPKKPKA